MTLSNIFKYSSFILCVAIMMVFPEFNNSFVNLSSKSLFVAEKGSSNTKISFSDSNALAINTICFSPPLNSLQFFES